MTNRQFTISELAALGVPPSHPSDLEYSDILLVDQPVTTLKYTSLRRCVFRADDDGRTYAVEYEGEIDMGDFEVSGGRPDNHGWHGDTVEATAVEEKPVIVKRWEPVHGQPATTGQPRTGPIESLTALWEQTGATPEEARAAAARWIVDHAGEAADLRDEYLFGGDDQ
ncbi:hypothetical protein [Streptomyces arboris]|uniref:hypothetical protein n=1 Tax=Streptomyces arboris TaxID=2600619 RepID=UPI003BF54572